MSRHWTESDFLDRLYEVGPEDNHLKECAECRAMWEQWAAMRRDLVVPHEVKPGFLAEQRRSIQDRIERRSGWPTYMKWSPAVALAGLALFAVLWRTPPPRETTDAQLMAEIYRTVSSTEPGMVEPLRGLFEQGAKQ